MGRGMNVGRWVLTTLKEHPQKVLFSPSETSPLHSHHIHPTVPQLSSKDSQCGDTHSPPLGEKAPPKECH